MSLQEIKVIHVPLEIAGQVGLICRNLRPQNITAVGYNYFDNYLRYEEVYSTDVFELLKGLPAFIQFFDIFHFHNGLTINEDFRDIQMIKESGKKMIMHHRGTDVRFRKLASENNPYVYADNSLDDAQIHKNLTLFAETMDAAIVQDYELYKYVSPYYLGKGKPVYILPRLIDTQSIQPNYPQLSQRPPKILHAPTHRNFKGSDIIEATIHMLNKEYPLEYQIIENCSHKETLRLMKNADIVIDQILCGAYGNVSVEAMALGKPVVCYIRPDFAQYYPGLPIVSANPDTLSSVLKRLVKNPEHLYELGQLGRAYVEKYHEGSRVIKLLIDVYKAVLQS